MSATLKERQRIIELVETGSANKTTIEATVRTIRQELPHITKDELVEVCRVHVDELQLDGAVQLAEAETLNFIANTLEEMGQADLIGAAKELIIRAEQGDQHADELLEQLYRAYVFVEGCLQENAK